MATWSSRSTTRPPRTTLTHKSCESVAAPDSVSPATTARIVEKAAAAIADGDWVVVRQQPLAEQGDIVAAMIDGEITVKTLHNAAEHVWLMPHNPAYAPISGDDATILGTMVAVLRRV